MTSDKTTSTEATSKKESASAGKTEAPKTGGGTEAGSAPKNYSRGEGQKPVTQAYKDNWNAIFGKKAKKKTKR